MFQQKMSMWEVDVDNERTGIWSVYCEVQIYGQHSGMREMARLSCACLCIVQRGTRILPRLRLLVVAVVAVHHSLCHIMGRMYE